jgi:hypothetical protein
MSATAVTTTATASAQGTPNAAAEAPKNPTPATTQAAPAPVVETKPSAEAAKVETKEPVKPAAEPAKEAVKADAKPATPEAPKEVVYDIPLKEGALVSKEDIEGIKGFAKANGYSNDQALSVTHYIDQARSQHKSTVEGWMEECKAHPKYGG